MMRTNDAQNGGICDGEIGDEKTVELFNMFRIKKLKEIYKKN